MAELAYQFYEASPYGSIVCYLWNNETHTVVTYLPFFINQFFVANLSYHVFYHLTRLLYLPPFVAQILSGLVFSPSLLGKLPIIQTQVFPLRYTMVYEMFANIALLYNVFLMGLEMDLTLINLTEFKPFSIASVGIIVSLVVGYGLYFLPGYGIPDKLISGCVYWAIVLSCTNFPDLAMILTDLKLLRSDMGKTAMSTAIVTDLGAMILLISAFAAFNKKSEYNPTMTNILLSTALFVLFCIHVARPAAKWVFSRTTKEGRVSDTHVWFVLGGVMFCGLITDACGTHSIVGAFMFGLVIPHEHIIRSVMEEKLLDFLSGTWMPLYYIMSGLRCDLKFMWENTDPLIMVFIICICVSAKIVSTFIIALVHGMPASDSLALGLIMNTKGVLSLIVLNSARDLKVIDSHMFTLMVIVLLVMSLLVEPLLALTYKPKTQLAHHKHRTVQSIKDGMEFRVLACVHDLQHAHGIVGLLGFSNPTKESPLNISIIHLVELSGRTTASMLIMNDENKAKVDFSDHVRAESDHISEIFKAVEVKNEAIKVQTVTAVSPYATMHEDICGLAEDNHAAIIILPYHKQQNADGKMEDANALHVDINCNVLDDMPCSVGIIVDRGIGSTQSELEKGKKKVAMLFVGGPDDREALAYVRRMAGDKSIALTVVRFVAGQEPSTNEEETQMDEDCVYAFNFSTRNNPSVTYIEKVVNDGNETLGILRDMEDKDSYDLYIVGKRNDTNSTVTMGLSDWGSSSELGTLAETLVSSEFTIHASVLVIQQYSATATTAAATTTHESVDSQKKVLGDRVEPFIKCIKKGNNNL